MGKMCVALASLLSVCSAVLAQDKPLVFVGAKIILIDGANIEKGVLVVHQGRITAVGAAGSTTIPDDAQRIDSTGKVIMPGLVDTHSHIGEISGGDSSGQNRGTETQQRRQRDTYFAQWSIPPDQGI